MSGNIENGRFFVGGKHGLREVSRTLYFFSAFLLLAVCASGFLALTRLMKFLNGSGIVKVPKIRYGLDKIVLALLFGMPAVGALICILRALLGK